MKAVSHMNLFGFEIRYREYNGQEDEFEYEGNLYLPLETAKKYYIVKKEWIEELD